MALSTVYCPNQTIAQPPGYTTENKRAIKLYESGADCMRLQQWSCAEGDLKKAAELDPKFIEPRIYLAEMYEQMDKANEAMVMYGEVVGISPRYFPPALLHLAELEFSAQKYEQARQHYKEFMAVDDDPVRKERALLGIDKCAFASEAVKHPVPFDPKNLGPGVNTPQAEAYPCVTADNTTLIFTRRLPEPGAYGGLQEDFFVSHRTASSEPWNTATRLPRINTKGNEGTGTLSPDGRFIIYTKCEEENGYGDGLKGAGSCDLFVSRRVGDQWSPPENLGAPLNTWSWETQPTLASDGRTLYFTYGKRDRRGGDIHDMDIYTSVLGDDGAFGKPQKMNANINTPGMEQGAFIHPDGRTLYFSSDGLPGMGGLDFFVSRKRSDGTWGPAENLGYPINTSGDEQGIIVTADGTVAYFASDRPGGQGDLDLYQFELPEAARANAVSYIRGKVHDKGTGKPVEADVQLYDLATGELATGAYSDPQSGEFLVCLPTGHEYALNASAEGYLFFSQNYSIAKGTLQDPVTLDVPLSPLSAGSTINLRNIFFNTASAELLPASNAELDKLVKLLSANPTLRIELGGHTDNVGDDKSNQTLSQQRADAVRTFVVSHGIDGARITAKGYGESKPVASNDTEEGRAQNRRTEVTVL